MIRTPPSGRRWTVVMRLRSLSKGTSSERGYRAESRAASRPSLAAAASSAASVGSPTAVQSSASSSAWSRPWRPGGRRAASLHRAAAVSSSARSGAVCGGDVPCRGGGSGRRGEYPLPSMVASPPVGVHSAPRHHPALGQGAGLVGGEHGHRAERLDGGEPADQGVAGGHPPGAQRQREGDHGRQGLGDGRDDEADRGDDHQLDGLPAQQAQAEHHGAQHHGHDRPGPGRPRPGGVAAG